MRVTRVSYGMTRRTRASARHGDKFEYDRIEMEAEVEILDDVVKVTEDLRTMCEEGLRRGQ